MKTRRIQIEGQSGKKATLHRDGMQIRIEIEGVRQPMLADAMGHDNWQVAADLQRRLDGYRGTQGDIADYMRAIATFEV